MYTCILSVGKINWGNIYKTPNIVLTISQMSVTFIVEQKSDAGRFSTMNLIGRECDLLVEMTLTHYAFESSLSIIYNTAMTRRQWEYY